MTFYYFDLLTNSVVSTDNNKVSATLLLLNSQEVVIPSQAILVDFSTGCSNFTFPLSSSMYPLMALLDFHNDDSSSSCSSFVSRLQSIQVSPLMQGVVLNVPTAFNSNDSDNIRSLQQAISNSKMPVFQLDSSDFALLTSKTISTIGKFDPLRSTKSNVGLVISLFADTNSSTSQNWTLLIVIILVFASCPFLLHFYNRTLRKKKQKELEELEQLRLARENAELERLQKTGNVINSEELQKLEFGYVKDLRLDICSEEQAIIFNVEVTTSSQESSKHLFPKLASIIQFSKKSTMKTITGSTEPEVEKLQDFQYTDVSCAICLEPLKVTDTYRKLHCSHIFHVDCVDTWLIKRSRYCPLCRIDAVRGIREEDMEMQTNTNGILPAETI
ncbi:hypothetical protein HK096_007765 [Nowakowskiella sp. JEL0078]|nr:hypothetical protein HK096_007765 [Nowakowskiella sp. JEL0078]